MFNKRAANYKLKIDSLNEIREIEKEMGEFISRKKDMLEIRDKIKIIKDIDEDKFSEKYHKFMRENQDTGFSYFNLGEVRDIREGKVEYVGKELILIFKYSQLELKSKYTIDDYKKVLEKIINLQEIYKTKYDYFGREFGYSKITQQVGFMEGTVTDFYVRNYAEELSKI